MKSLLLLPALLLAVTVHAAPSLVVDASLREKQPGGGAKLWKTKPVRVARGKTATFHLGDVELKVTPTTKDDGHILVPLIMTRGSGQNAKLLGRPAVTTREGQQITVGTGNLTFTVVVTLAK